MSTKLIELKIEIYPQGGVVASYTDNKQPITKRPPDVALFGSESVFQAKCRNAELDLSNMIGESEEIRDEHTIKLKRYELAAMPEQLAVLWFGQKGKRINS